MGKPFDPWRRYLDPYAVWVEPPIPPKQVYELRDFVGMRSDDVERMASMVQRMMIVCPGCGVKEVADCNSLNVHYDSATVNIVKPRHWKHHQAALFACSFVCLEKVMLADSIKKQQEAIKQQEVKIRHLKESLANSEGHLTGLREQLAKMDGRDRIDCSCPLAMHYAGCAVHGIMNTKP